MDVTQGDEARAIDIFDDALGDMSSFGEFGQPSYRDGALRTISMHLAAHRQAALLEGVRIGLEAAAEAAVGYIYPDYPRLPGEPFASAQIQAIDPATVLAQHGGNLV